MKLWHATTYRLENTLDYRMERVWGIGYIKVRGKGARAGGVSWEGCCV